MCMTRLNRTYRQNKYGQPGRIQYQETVHAREVTLSILKHRVRTVCALDK